MLISGISQEFFGILCLYLKTEILLNSIIHPSVENSDGQLWISIQTVFSEIEYVMPDSHFNVIYKKK